MRKIFLFFVVSLVLTHCMVLGTLAQEKRAAFTGMRGRRSDSIIQDQEKRAAFMGMRGKKAAFMGMRGKKDDWPENDYNNMEGEEEQNQMNSLRQFVKRQYKAQAVHDYEDLWGKLFQYKKRRANSGFVGLRG